MDTNKSSSERGSWHLSLGTSSGPLLCFLVDGSPGASNINSMLTSTPRCFQDLDRRKQRIWMTCANRQRAFGLEGWTRYQFDVTEMSRVGESKIGYEIVEIARIISRFPQTVSQFRCGTRNGWEYINHGGAKLRKWLYDISPWIEVCNHNVSWTRSVDLKSVLLIDVDLESASLISDTIV